jgi:putative phage-type endonuclease
MSLTEYPEVIQGTPEWHDQRRGMVTASAVGTLVTASTLKPAQNDTSRGLTAMLVAERITGYTDPTFFNDDMLRGTLDEPRARDLYSEHYAEARETGFLVRDDWGYQIGYSPDGLVGDDGLIEVKAPRAKTHLRTVLADEVPAQHMAQLQAGLLVSGRQWIDFISYSGGMPMWKKRVLPDQRWFDAIVAAVALFEKTAEQMISDYLTKVDGLPATERIDNSELGLVF